MLSNRRVVFLPYEPRRYSFQRVDQSYLHHMVCINVCLCVFVCVCLFVVCMFVRVFVCLCVGVFGLIDCLFVRLVFVVGSCVCVCVCVRNGIADCGKGNSISAPMPTQKPYRKKRKPRSRLRSSPPSTKTLGGQSQRSSSRALLGEGLNRRGHPPSWTQLELKPSAPQPGWCCTPGPPRASPSPL